MAEAEDGSSEEGQVKVILTTRDKSQTRVYLRHPDDVIASVRKQWAEDLGVDANSFVLRSTPRPLSDELTVQEAGLDDEGRLDLIVKLRTDDGGMITPPEGLVCHSSAQKSTLTTAVETQTEDSSTEPKPEEDSPTEPKPEEDSPTEPKPEEDSPTEPKPEEDSPTEPKSEEDSPTEPKPEKDLPTEPKPEEDSPTEPKPEEDSPTEPKPEEDSPTEPKSEEDSPTELNAEDSSTEPKSEEDSPTEQRIEESGPKADSELHCFPPASARMEIRVVVSSSRPILHTAQRDDTIGSVIDDLRRTRNIMGVRELWTGSAGSLMTAPNWRQRTLGELGIGPGTVLFIDPILPPAVQVLALTPTMCLGVAAGQLPIASTDETDCHSLTERFCRAQQIAASSASAVTMQCRTLYLRDGQTREALRCYISEANKYAYVDVEDGAEDTGTRRTHLLLEFPFGGSRPRAAAAHSPVLELNTRVEVLAVDADAQLRPSFRDALLFPTAAAMLRGLFLRDAQGQAAALLLRLRGGHFVDTETGEVFAQEEAATRSKGDAQGGQAGTWYIAYLLLNHGDPVPRYRVADGRLLEVFTRQGVHAELRGDRIVARRSGDLPPGGAWIINWTGASPLETTITERMRR